MWNFQTFQYSLWLMSSVSFCEYASSFEMTNVEVQDNESRALAINVTELFIRKEEIKIYHC